uniref:Protein TIC 214 n=1 Tax=Haplomitrium blumei TaxID=258993 RepID=A0A4Y5P8P6_9MARC|nr:Ycf1 [Haplomitrium blumei]QCW59386.1 Ycf1 [Haplomitrium blumei]
MTVTSIPSLLSPLWAQTSSWIHFSGPFILFGMYYGFLTTLPIGPSQILSIRAFLLGGRLSGLIATGGLCLGQLMAFLSIYHSPLYVVLVKPHAITFSVLPCLLFHWYRTKDLPNYQSLRPIESLADDRIYTLFVDSLVFQLLNPVLLPSPVLSRLVNLFLFRHSQNSLFVFSCFLGWFTGQILFVNSCKLLLFRVEADSTVLYLLVKRVIHRIFSIFIFGFCLLHLGRTPTPSSAKEVVEDSQMNASKFGESLPFAGIWPILFFDPRKWNRPLRFIGNSRFGNRSPVKGRVSQYFFSACSDGGGGRISHTCLPGPATFRKDLHRPGTPSPYSHFCRNWMEIRDAYQDLYEEFRDRIEFLGDGYSPVDAEEKRAVLFPLGGGLPEKCCDPFLGNQFRQTMIISKSTLLSTDESHKSTKRHRPRYLPRKTNKLKNWISDQWKDLDRETLVLPWEPLAQDARRTLSLLINRSKNAKYDTNSQEIDSFDEVGVRDKNKRNNYSEFFADVDDLNSIRRKMARKSPPNWELILNLSPTQRTLYFNHLETEKWSTAPNYWKKFSSGDFNQFSNLYSLFGKTSQSRARIQIREVDKEIPRWPSNLRNEKFDVIAVGVTDIRQRKVKNLGYIVRGRGRRRRIVRRFSQQSDSRRKLVKGSMRSRRRKTVVWKIFQLRIHSPFFLRITDEYAPSRSLPKSRGIFRDMFTDGSNSFFGRGIISPKKTRADRLSIANRWDFPLAQWGRSWLPIVQSHLRKYIVLPMLIISKNIGRFLLFQIPEWDEDWYGWNREIHIKCTYDGTEVSGKELPEQWLRDGLQIKIIYPFRLKPWHNKKKVGMEAENPCSDLFSNGNKRKNNLLARAGDRRMNYSHSTAWGFQTDLPFGDMKRHPPFWGKIGRELNKRLGVSIPQKVMDYSPTNRLYTLFRSISKTGSVEEPLASRNDYLEGYSEGSDSNKTYGGYNEARRGSNRASKLLIAGIDETPPEAPQKKGYGTQRYVRELKDLEDKKTNRINERNGDMSLEGLRMRKSSSANENWRGKGWGIARRLGIDPKGMRKLPQKFMIRSRQVRIRLEMILRFVTRNMRKSLFHKWN